MKKKWMETMMLWGNTILSSHQKNDPQKQKEIFAAQVEEICADYCAVEKPDMKIGPLALQKQKSHNTLLFYSNGDVSYNFPNYFIPPKEYPYIQTVYGVGYSFDV